MTHIPPSEDNVRMYDIHPLAKRHEQRHLALRTVENCFSRLELQKKYDINKLRFYMNERFKKVIFCRRIDE
jgi:hypothetical protein